MSPTSGITRAVQLKKASETKLDLGYFMIYEVHMKTKLLSMLSVFNRPQTWFLSQPENRFSYGSAQIELYMTENRKNYENKNLNSS